MANTSTRGILLTMLSAVTFGFAFTLGPMTYGEAGSNPVTLTFLRNFLSLPVLLAILWYQGISLQVSAKELWSLTILGGIGNAVTTLMLFIAFSLIDVGVATTIHFIYPVFVTIGCVLFYKERLGLQKFIALLIATAGIACFFLGVDMSAGFSGGTFLGLFLAVASGVTYAFYIIYMDKSGLKNQPVFKISFYVALMSSIAMGIFGIGTGELTLTTLTPQAWFISTVFALLCTVVALSLLQIGIKHVGASTAAILTTFEPITSIICGVLLLGETVTTIKIVACALIMTGVVTLVVIFQPELRNALENIGGKTFLGDFFNTGRGEIEKFSDKTIDELVRACFAMGRVKTGALIVMEDEINLGEYIRTGIDVDAILTSQLLINIFEKNTPLHDGAVIVRGNRVVSATCYLPLSDSLSLSKDLGTRHRAAVGVSEVSDSLTIIVSEETGSVSTAYKGQIEHDIDADHLRTQLKLLQNRHREPGKFELIKRRFKNGKEASKNLHK